MAVPIFPTPRIYGPVTLAIVTVGEADPGAAPFTIQDSAGNNVFQVPHTGGMFTTGMYAFATPASILTTRPGVR